MFWLPSGMKDETIWTDVGYVVSSSYRKKVLEILDKPKMPSTMSREVNVNKTHISRALKELVDKDIIKCLNPESNKGKLYVISDYGKKILEKVNKI